MKVMFLTEVTLGTKALAAGRVFTTGLAIFDWREKKKYRSIEKKLS